MMQLTLFRRLALLGTVLALVVVVLGAYVRLNNAGLGCPDWPGCYGHLTVGQAVEHAQSANAAYPDRPLEAGKALKEMVHRYFASTLGLVVIALAVIALLNRRDRNQPVRLPVALVLLVVFQGLLGMWTVTLLLKPLIVTSHLVGGMTTMSLLWWLALNPTRTTRPNSERNLRALAVIALVVLAMQIMLGGWVSANYSAVACPDFPTCQRSFWPDMDFKDAFVLWRGLGIDYEGGVLDNPARVAIHVVHRLGAIVTALMLGYTAWRALRTAKSGGARMAGTAMAAMLVTQLVLGPTMVLMTFPLPLATAHNAVAALLLLSVVALVRFLWPAQRSL
jgi:cytochrome c oxidase assembly protein subunit 15